MTKIEGMQSKDASQAQVDTAIDKLIEYIKNYTKEEIEFALNTLRQAYTESVNNIEDISGVEYIGYPTGTEYDIITHPSHYCSHGIETIDKIEAVTKGLPANKAIMLANVIKYLDRAGYKDDAEQDLKKAHAYAYRLVFDRWPETDE